MATLPDGWSAFSLGDFVTLQRGHDLPDGQRRRGLIPILGSFGITGWHDEAKAAGPGVSIGRSGASIGVATYTELDYWPLNTVLYVTDFRGNDPRFVYYWFRANDLRGFNSGSAQASLNRNFLYRYLANIPRPAEQKAISALLGALDDKVELSRRMNETIMALVRAIATLAARDSAERKLAEVAAWERAIVNPGETPDVLFEHFSLPAFDDGQVPVKETGTMIKSQKLRVPHGAVLVAKLNPHIPRVWRPDDVALQNPVASTEWVILRPLEAGAADLLHALVSSEEFTMRLATLTTGTTGSHQRVKPQDVLDMTVRWPQGSAEIKTFIRILYDMSRSNSRQSQTLLALRDTLLPRLISGELRIRPAEELVEVAT